MGGSVHFLISALALGALLETAPLRAPSPPRPAQFVEPDIVHFRVFGSGPRCTVGFGLFCGVTQIKLLRRCAEVGESQVCLTGMNSSVFRDITRVNMWKRFRRLLSR